jgi:hypothetical protein
MSMSNWSTIRSLIEKAFRRVTGLPKVRVLQILEAEIRRLL